MKKALFISIISLTAMLSSVSAKETVSNEAKPAEAPAAVQTLVLKGNVTDKQTNESLAGAIVTANGQKVYTDLDGNFRIDNVCNGKCTIKVSLISYEDQTIEVNTSDNAAVAIKLNQR